MTVRLLLLLGSIAGNFLDSDERGMELRGLCWGDGSGWADLYPSRKNQHAS